MKYLESKVKVQNRTLRQVKREGRVALYELLGAQGLLYGFELVIIKIHPTESIRGRSYPAREGFPANEDWGKLAWSYGRNSRGEAEEGFTLLCRKQAEGSLPEIDLADAEGQDSGPSSKTI